MTDALALLDDDQSQPLPRAVIVDIDGTVALHTMPDGRPRRGHHEYRLVAWDLPNQPVIDIVRALHDAGHLIVFCTGRPAMDRKGYDVSTATRSWLELHIGPWAAEAPLLMRRQHDGRPDDVVKHELFEAHVRGKFDVRLALDDRDRVVALWRSLGLVCLQVAPGDF